MIDKFISFIEYLGFKSCDDTIGKGINVLTNKYILIENNNTWEITILPQLLDTFDSNLTLYKLDYSLYESGVKAQYRSSKVGVISEDAIEELKGYFKHIIREKNLNDILC